MSKEMTKTESNGCKMLSIN